MTAKPLAEDLGIDVSALDWQRSGAGEGSIEVAFVHGDDRVPGEDSSTAMTAFRGRTAFRRSSMPTAASGS